VLAPLSADVRVLRPISRTVFRPVPNVDSVLVGLTRTGPRARPRASAHSSTTPSPTAASARRIARARAGRRARRARAGPCRADRSSITPRTSAPSGSRRRSSASSSEGSAREGARLRQGQPVSVARTGSRRRPPRAGDADRVGSARRQLEVTVLSRGSDEVICDGGRGRQPRRCRAAGASRHRLGRAHRCGSRSRSGSRSPPGWAGARPTRRLCCGWPRALLRFPAIRSGSLPSWGGRAEPGLAGAVARDRRRGPTRAARAAGAARARDRAVRAPALDPRRVRGGRSTGGSLARPTSSPRSSRSPNPRSVSTTSSRPLSPPCVRRSQAGSNRCARPAPITRSCAGLAPRSGHLVG